MPCPFQWLVITDGTKNDAGTRNQVDLLSPAGFCVLEDGDWRPAITVPKGGGVWKDSALAEGRRPADFKPQNVTEQMTLTVTALNQDALIRDTQELRRLLTKARTYGTTKWQDEPVWIEAQGPGETNMRYTIVWDWRTPNDGNPYEEPFFQKLAGAGMADFTLTLEREPYWRHVAPGSSECTEIAGYGTYCWPCHIEFNATTTIITVPDNAAIQDLHDAAMTVESWIYAEGWGENNAGCVITKEWSVGVGWRLHLDSTVGLQAYIDCAVADTFAQSGLVAFSPDSAWHHVAFTWDDASYTNPRLWIDGAEQTNTTQARNGAIVSDVGNNLIIGNRVGSDRTFDGGIGWTRVSNIVRYTTAFTPPAQCVLPDPADPNTVGQWIGAECSGTNIDNQEGTAAIDGTLANGTFDCDCEHYYGNVAECSPSFLEFNGTTSILVVPDAVSIQDLHDDAMTAEAWIRPDSWGEGNNGFVINKEAFAGVGWQLEISIVSGVAATIQCAVADGFTQSTIAAFTLDGLWHHVAFTWDDTWGAAFPRLWIDGVEQSNITVNRNGAIVSDVGNDLYIGSRADGAATFDGDIGWTRVSDIVRYTATFTPPPRCALPASDANTMLLEIYEGFGLTALDLSGNGNNGTITLATWGCDCVANAPIVVPTCTEEAVFLGNKHNMANITHIFTWSAANGFSANLVGGGLPFALIDIVGAAPAVNDYVVFGINTALPDSGPFASLVFDIGTAIAGITVDDWEYSTGGPGWANLAAEQDNTNADGVMSGSAFDTIGIRSIHWEQPAAWATQAENGITGYWIRVLVTAAPGPHTAPTQQNREVYTITWAFLEASSTAVLGDVPALVRLLPRGQSDAVYTIPTAPSLFSTRMLIGLRSYDRGPDFTAYINLADEQNPTGITVSDTGGGPTFFVTDPETPSGRLIRCPNIGAGVVLAQIDFAATILDDFSGKFHLFMRVDQTSGVAGDIYFRFDVRFGSHNWIRWTPDVYTATTNDWALMDFGQVVFPPASNLLSSELGTASLQIVGTGDGAVDIDLFDLIFLPIDEWTIDTAEPYPGIIPPGAALGGRGATAVNSQLDIDGIVVPKRRVRTLLKRHDNGQVVSIYLPSSIGMPIAQANARQRYWFLQEDISTNPALESEPEVAVSITLDKVQRYYSMRGSR